jgi:hypothetical protein
MFDLNSIIQSAQGGQAIDNIASQFGLPPDQARQAIQALLPALSAGLKNQAGDPAAVGAMLGHVSDPQHQAAFQDPDAAQSDEAQMAGSQALSQIVGGQNVIDAVAQRAADATGISPELLQQMLPQITSIALGGLMTAAQNKGFGGVIGQLGDMARSGGLGDVLGQALGQGGTPAGGGEQTNPSQSGSGSQGGLGGLLGGIVGSLFGGGAPTSGAATPSSVDPAEAQSGLASLTSMFEHGTDAEPGLEQAFGQLLAKS